MRYEILWIVNDLYTRFSHLLEQINLAWLDPEMFAEAIHMKGAPLKNCWGLIDGTARPICRPIVSQRVMFSGHKRIHCIKLHVGVDNAKAVLDTCSISNKRLAIYHAY